MNKKGKELKYELRPLCKSFFRMSFFEIKNKDKDLQEDFKGFSDKVLLEKIIYSKTYSLSPENFGH